MDMQELKRLIYKGEKVNMECKEAESNVPKSAYESYSGFANTKGGYIILGVKEDKKNTSPEGRFMIQGIKNPRKQIEDFWNNINGNKVNANILKDEDVFIVEDDGMILEYYTMEDIDKETLRKYRQIFEIRNTNNAEYRRIVG